MSYYYLIFDAKSSESLISAPPYFNSKLLELKEEVKKEGKNKKLSLPTGLERTTLRVWARHAAISATEPQWWGGSKPKYLNKRCFCICFSFRAFYRFYKAFMQLTSVTSVTSEVIRGRYDSFLLHSKFQSWQMRSLPTLDPYRILKFFIF